MKRIILLFSAFIVTISLNAQEESKTYKNEIGLDATGFIRTIVNFNSDNQNYFPTYYLSYRRKFKPGNIRFAIGGNYDKRDIPAVFENDINAYYRSSKSFDARIGWEFKTELSRRWQVYYGMDVRPGFNYYYNDAQYWNGGYANGIETKTQVLGFAPLLGFRFKLTDRISLLTESSLSLNFEKTDTRRFYTPIDTTFPEIQDNKNPTTQAVYTSFLQPLSIFFTFDF